MAPVDVATWFDSLLQLASVRQGNAVRLERLGGLRYKSGANRPGGSLLPEAGAMLRALILPCVVMAIGWTWAQQATAGVQLDAEKIKVALRTVTPDDEAFVDRVVAMVKEGKLPVDLVNSTLQWARKKQAYQFQYFKRAIILRAAKQGISITS
jgi:hypothetical protein